MSEEMHIIYLSALNLDVLRVNYNTHTHSLSLSVLTLTAIFQVNLG